MQSHSTEERIISSINGGGTAGYLFTHKRINLNPYPKLSAKLTANVSKNLKYKS
jgi:hypothetical protein